MIMLNLIEEVNSQLKNLYFNLNTIFFIPDALGLSRAILCNDSLVKKLEDLQHKENMYRSLMEQTKRLLKAFFDLAIVYKRK